MENFNRYKRQIILPEIGIEGQQKLSAAKVLVVGAGGLGSPVLLYLAAAGVGNIGIVDFDVVDESNLQRQVIFTEDDLGKPKAFAAAERIKKLNSAVFVESINEKLTSANVSSIISGYDIIVDCCDNFNTRYLIDDVCAEQEKPLVSGSINRFEGQLSVFHFKNDTAYRSLYPEPPTDSLACSEIGVLGVLPGIIGTLQATEVIKIITDAGEALSGKLLIVNALTLQFTTLRFSSETSSAIEPKGIQLKALTHAELEQLNQEELQFIDVRDEYELDEKPFRGINIPLHKLKDQLDIIDKQKKVICFCDRGNRSEIAAKYLLSQGFSNVFSLEGGIISRN